MLVEDQAFQVHMYISANLNASLIRGVELKNPVLVDRAKEVPSSSQDGAGLACKDNSTFFKAYYRAQPVPGGP